MSMQEKQILVVASNNKDKLKEIGAILSPLPVIVLSANDFPDLAPVIEDRDTIEGNAMKKALETAVATGHFCLADDTGLFVEALNGAPGVFAARFAGEGCTYRDNRLKLIKELGSNPLRQADFKTVMALASPDGILSTQLGSVSGTITYEEKGEKGFGYDAVFEVDGTGKTYAEMDIHEKNTLSHRAIALRKMLPTLQDLFSVE